MGSIQKILDSMTKIREDKTAQMTARVEEQSIWLANELELIKKLILKDPRQKQASEASSVLSTIVSVASSSAPAAPQGDFLRQKRKSPVVTLNGPDGPSQSPLLKRQASLAPELDVLSIDLNRLRKDQLLEELEKRGVKSYTMKALKKDLIDGLRAVALQQQQQQEEATVSAPSELYPNVISSPQPAVDIEPLMNIIQPSASPVMNPRKASLMSDFRSVVAANPLNKSSETSEEKKMKTEQEFEARQKRHRESQIRKSQPSLDETQSDASVEKNSVSESPVRVLAQRLSQQYRDTVTSPGEDTWMDVSSPVNVSSTTVVSSVSKPEPSPLQNEKELLSETTDELNGKDGGPQPPMAITLEGQDEVVEVKRLSVTSEASNVSTASFKSAASSIHSGNSKVAPSAVAPAKKPTNILTGQTSFLDKPATKPNIYVAALEKAKQAKAAEDLKLQQKKQAQALKAANTASNAHAKLATVPATSINKQPIPVVTKPAAPVATAPAAAPAPAPKKAGLTAGGIFSALLGKKTVTTPFGSPVAASKTIASIPVAAVPPPDEPVEATAPVVAAAPAPTLTESKKSVESPSNRSITVLSPAAAVQLPMTTHHPSPVIVPTEAASKTNDENADPNDEYEFDDDDSSGSGTDDENENEPDEQKKKDENVPDWARGPKLKEALERQLGLDGSLPVDPDAIFPEVQTCNLEEIFGMKGGNTRQYSQRNSSGMWDQDALTLVEKRTYRTQMGYSASIY